MILAGVRAVVFDLDGVLMLSTGIHDAAFRAVLEPLGIHDFVYQPFAGMRTKDTLQAVFEARGVQGADVNALALRKTQLAHERIRAENPIAPGCLETLTALHRRFPLALASSASPENVAAFLETNACRQLFAVVLDGTSVRHAKPSPEIYQAAFRQLGFDPGDCLVVEDAVAGIQAAHQAGARICGIGPPAEAQRLLDAGAAIVISQLEELLTR